MSNESLLAYDVISFVYLSQHRIFLIWCAFKLHVLWSFCLFYLLMSLQPDRVSDFCKKNKLQLIIRAHECVMDGFERFAQGQLITLFSATNYCGKLKSLNFLLLKSDLNPNVMYQSRDCKQCWSYTGGWQGFGCGSKINSSLATSPSITRDVSGTCHWWCMDAGKIYSIFNVGNTAWYPQIWKTYPLAGF